MKTELKDVIHFYIGSECEVLMDLESPTDYFRGGGNRYVIGGDLLSALEFNNATPIENYVMPLLRPLASMTEEEIQELLSKEPERVEYFKRWLSGFRQDTHLLNTQQFLWLCKMGFDLFNLIPQGIAKEKI